EGSNFVQNLPELHYELDLDKVHYLTSPNRSGPEYAVSMLYEHSGGGIFFHEGIAQVLELSNRRQLRVVQENSADAAGNNFVNDRTKTLVMYSDHYLEGDAHCCISARDVFTLKWNGSRFVQTSIRTELTDWESKRARSSDHELTEVPPDGPLGGP